MDITEVSRQVSGPSDFVPDGLHPTGAAYGTWVDILLPAVEEILSKEMGKL